MAHNRPTEQDTSSKGGAQRNPVWTVLAIAGVVGVVICLIIATVLALRDDDSAGTGAGPQSTPPPVSASTRAPGELPGQSDPQYAGLRTPITDAFGRRVDVPKWSGGWALPQDSWRGTATWSPNTPVPAPAGLMWQKVNDGVIVPFSTSDGPRTVYAGQALGFRHSPQGAAIAVSNISLRIAGSVNEMAQVIYDEQVEMTTEQRAQLNSDLAKQGPYYRELTDAAMTYQARPDAFRIVDYSDDYAIIEIASRAPESDTASTPTQQWITNRWQAVWDGDAGDSGDWKLQLPTADNSGTTTSLEGWTPW